MRPKLRPGAIATDAADDDTEKTIAHDGRRTVRQHARPGYTLQVKGASHLSFMDAPFLPVSAEGPVKAVLAATLIQPRRMWRITCDVLLALFARHLGQAAGLLLEGPSGSYPELTFGAP